MTFGVVDVLGNKEFFDAAFYHNMQLDFEDIRRRRKLRPKGKPSPEEMALINCEREFESFYKRFLDL